jgi:mannonate dehydratase
MAFWFAEDRKYEKGKFQKYKTLHEGHLDRPMPRGPNPNQLDPNGPKIECLVSPDPTDSEIQFLQQMGVTHCYAWLTDEQSNVPFVSKLVNRLRAANIVLWTVGNVYIGKSPDIILGTPDREAAIQRFRDFLLVLKESGVGTSIFTWEPWGVTSTHYAYVRGQSTGRAVDLALLEAYKPDKSNPGDGKVFTEEALWSNMEYFLQTIIPFCEKHQMRLALHPNDPPVPAIGGVPCIMRNKAAFERVFSIVKDSPALGVEFCVGTWSEGGKNFTTDIHAALREFTQRGKIVKIHLRNITGTLDEHKGFVETFLDDGVVDIYAIIRTLVRCGYQNTIILDHTPPFVKDAGAGAPTAFSLGMIKAWIRAAEAEVALEKKSSRL